MAFDPTGLFAHVQYVETFKSIPALGSFPLVPSNPQRIFLLLWANGPGNVSLLKTQNSTGHSWQIGTTQTIFTYNQHGPFVSQAMNVFFGATQEFYMVEGIWIP